ncbi:L-rhamnose-binding lectin SML-like isoform X2 [Notolabrus celidotus]|uniref:L-rhamnose-binding lectin SML-like isoform X2 n=1 Tax=Notolabrus celidotus TaxID=1203425 RepID=UPI001490486D|nr:L-rhamnose-binding lectin SML-like isoform X2 [Notolabrus celidotus]
MVLAATCLLMTPVDSSKSVITCDNARDVQRLRCDSGVIMVEAALYGRQNTMFCSAGRDPDQLADTECAQDGTMDIIKKRCDGKMTCEFDTRIVRTSDPCVGIDKYLQTNYTCVPAFHMATCEHSYATLSCSEGRVIFVYGADFGRRDRTTCSHMRTAAQIADVECSDPTALVAERCNGKSSCMIKASDSVFGDPCPGITKYLELAYVCEYTVKAPEESDHMME